MSGPTFLLLLVEDNPDHRTLLRLALEGSDLNVGLWVAPSGETALEYLLGHPPMRYMKEYPRPDLVLLDLDLPGMSGFDVLRAIRESERRADVPVLVLTVSDDVKDERMALEFGATAFLQKPPDFADIIPVVRELLGTEGERQQGTGTG